MDDCLAEHSSLEFCMGHTEKCLSESRLPTQPNQRADLEQPAPPRPVQYKAAPRAHHRPAAITPQAHHHAEALVEPTADDRPSPCLPPNSSLSRSAVLEESGKALRGTASAAAWFEDDHDFTCTACDVSPQTPPLGRPTVVSVLADEFGPATATLKAALRAHRPPLAFAPSRGSIDWHVSFFAGFASISSYRKAADPATEDLWPVQYARLPAGALFNPCPGVTAAIGHKRGAPSLRLKPRLAGQH